MCGTSPDVQSAVHSRLGSNQINTETKLGAICLSYNSPLFISLHSISRTLTNKTFMCIPAQPTPSIIALVALATPCKSFAALIRVTPVTPITHSAVVVSATLMDFVAPIPPTPPPPPRHLPLLMSLSLISHLLLLFIKSLFRSYQHSLGFFRCLLLRDTGPKLAPRTTSCLHAQLSIR